MFGTFVFSAAAFASMPNCREPVTQYDMNICSLRDFEAADRQLNLQWKSAVARAKEEDIGIDDKRPSHQIVLLEGQRAWLKFRDAHCTSEGYLARGGSMEPLLVNTCMEQLTRARTKQLQELMKGLGE